MAALFPRSTAYDPAWIRKNRMGPNALWLAESLSSEMTLEAGARLLDLGCGKAISSVFFAKEFGTAVWATDLWIKPPENWGRIQAAELAGQVHPIFAEAHALPYADGFFDAIVSLDAYHYFGSDDLYLKHILSFLRPGGEIGIILSWVPARGRTAERAPLPRAAVSRRLAHVPFARLVAASLAEDRARRHHLRGRTARDGRHLGGVPRAHD